MVKTPRLILTRPGHEDAEQMLLYYQKNRLNFKSWEPRRDDGFFTLESMQARIDEMNQKMDAHQSLHLLLREPGAGKLAGECGFTNIVRGPFQACHLGFSISQEFEGRGLMYEALSAALGFVFAEFQLHRVMANYRPENQRSARLLRRLGFEEEGRARAYLMIDGMWADHILTSLINDKLL